MNLVVGRLGNNFERKLPPIRRRDYMEHVYNYIYHPYVYKILVPSGVVSVTDLAPNPKLNSAPCSGDCK